MHADRIHRRKQFSSCDSCRKSRVACDALRRRSTGESSVATCTRCATRNRKCSFEWMKRAASKPSRSSTSSVYWDRLLSSPRASSPDQNDHSSLKHTRHSISDGPFPNRVEVGSIINNGRQLSITSEASQQLSAEASDWLRAMYEDAFEAVFGSWLGNYCCPFAFGERGHLENGPDEQAELALSVSVSSLCRQFDQLMKDLERQSQSAPKVQPLTQVELEKEWQIEQTLNLAIQTFSARWLPLTCQSETQRAAQTPLIQRLWRGLRRDLQRSINRPCYRSIISLYLYAMVPVPIGIPEEEEEDGLPAQICVQASLQQVQYLRARQRSLEFNGSKVSLLSDQTAPISTPEQIRSDFMHIENMLYWAAMTFDTSSSLTFNTRSVLSAGLLGWESEGSWRMVKTCTDIFHQQSENWRRHGVLITEDTANQIIAAAQAWKLRMWKMGTILKEALREGHGEDAVHHAYSCAADAIEQFNVTYRPLLAACERRLQFLSEHTKLRWYELMVHHNLAILITIDAVEVASRTDILDKMRITRSDAEGSFLNTLEFGLNNLFTIPKRHDGQDTGRSVPLVAIDPYPHHVVAGVQLLWKGVERDHEESHLDREGCRQLQIILLRTLELLPQTSKSVQKATEQARLALSPHI